MRISDWSSDVCSSDLLHERSESGAGQHAEAAVLDRGDARRARHGADRRHFPDQSPRSHVPQYGLAPVRRDHGNLKPAANDQIDVVRGASFGDQQLALAGTNGRGARHEGGGKPFRYYLFAVDPPDQRIRLRTHPATPLPPEAMPNCVKQHRSEEHTSELPSLLRSSYADFCLKKKIQKI